MTTVWDDSAFPVFDSDGFPSDNGLTKREYFAAIALQGLLAGGKYFDVMAPVKAVELADSLIEKLNREQNEKPNSEEPTQEEEGTEA